MAKENMVWKRVKKTYNAKTLHSTLQVIRNSIACHAISGFFSQSDHLKQVRTIETARWDLVKGDRDCSIEVTV